MKKKQICLLFYEDTGAAPQNTLESVGAMSWAFAKLVKSFFMA